MTHECRCHHHSSPVLDRLAPVGAGETVADVARRHAGALEIMKAMGINHCCGTHLTLREAAAAAGVTLDALLTALNEPRQTAA